MTTPKIPLIAQKTKRQITGIFVLVILLYIASAFITNAYPNRILDGLPIIYHFIIHDLLPPNWSYYTSVLKRLLETWNIALLSSTISAIVCLPLSFLAARNINRNTIFYSIVRFGFNILRTIPDLVLAVIVVAIVGLGALSGMLTLFIFSLGILAKLLSETIEAIDPGPLEAIRATGGNVFQVIAYGAIPQIMPHYASYSLFILEINVRASVVLGFVGAGGIGMILKQQLALFNYGNAAIIIMVTFIVVSAIDIISNNLRERLV